MSRSGNPQNVAMPQMLAPQMNVQPAQPSGPNVFQQAASGLTDAMAGTRGAMGYNPQNVSAQTAVGGINTYMNPYTQQVIDTSMRDLERQRQMQQNQMGAQATAAGAFGGSRQGVAEAETNRAFADQGGQLAAQLRQQGFQTALGASQQDVANRMQAAQANQQAGLQGAQLRMGAANQLGGLAGQGFGFGQSIQQQQAAEGLQSQQMNQALIDAAKGQFGNFTGAPNQSIQQLIGALGGANMGQQSQTSTRNPGLFDYIAAGSQLFCWVAREVYGEEDDSWKQFRAWMFGAAPDWLFNAYSKHGEAFAGIVRKVPFLKRILRPLMDRARRAAGFEV